MTANYEELLEKAKKELPERAEEEARFEVPSVKGHFEGTKTVVSNFVPICQHLQRDPKHVLKFVLKELATPGEISKTSVILGRKVNSARLNEKINLYVKEFVTCKECHKPDTELSKEGSIYLFRCKACGARYTFHAKI
ncbi:MAG: translation initiation factor IF-2 subunit beta [Candidatus Woesearchaeota archaeon]|nr:MAG: translation initiation factor IF-2 subunit beta [Candidatus Woesearchaeota archaeon]